MCVFCGVCGVDLAWPLAPPRPGCKGPGDRLRSCGGFAGTPPEIGDPAQGWRAEAVGGVGERARM
jgi:hypothetical protein